MLFTIFIFFAFHLAQQTFGNTFTLGNDTSSSCTYSLLAAKISEIKAETNPKSSASPHLLTFNCGSSPVTIEFSTYFFIDTSLHIDGSNNDITFDGQNKTRFFVVASQDTTWGILGSDCNLLLTNIKFQNGQGNDLLQASRPGWGNPQIDSSGNFINPVKKQDGGAIYVGREGFLKINGCSFVSCSSKGTLQEGGSEPDDITYNGGAVFLLTKTTLEIKNSIFSGNTAKGQGGAIFASWQSTQLTIESTDFNNNIALYNGEGGGGAIRLHETELTVKNCTFTKNEATLGAGISNLLSDLSVEDSVFDSNKAQNPLGLDHEARGSIYVDGARSKTSKQSGYIKIKNTKFTRNWSGQKGGGVYICPYGDGTGDQVTFENLYFCNNTVQGNKLVDGNKHNYGAGFSCDCGASNTKLTLNNVFIAGNIVVNKEDYIESAEQFYVSNQQIPIVKQGTNILPTSNSSNYTCPDSVFIDDGLYNNNSTNSNGDANNNTNSSNNTANQSNNSNSSNNTLNQNSSVNLSSNSNLTKQNNNFDLILRLSIWPIILILTALNIIS